MNKKIIVNYNQKPRYEIVFSNTYENIYLNLENLHIKNRKVCIVSDSNVSNLYINELIKYIKDCTEVVETWIFSAGEENKNLNTVQNLYEHLIKLQFDRNDILIALGGGVTGDLTGYVAATYLRGIRVIQVPTTLLSMVDSSIGGKTGVDFNAYKNMVGAFKQPELVYINSDVLKTLSDEQLASGMGEVIKHGLIKNKNYYEYIKQNINEIKNRNTQILNEIIYQSCIIKQSVVEIDPEEKGERALLNFGHTIGHAVEKLMNFKMFHGHCVAIGMVAASYISYKKGYIKKEELYDIENILKMSDLPIRIKNLNARDILITTKNDKKMDSGKIKFILLNKIGNSIIEKNITDAELLEAIKYIIK